MSETARTDSPQLDDAFSIRTVPLITSGATLLTLIAAWLYLLGWSFAQEYYGALGFSLRELDLALEDYYLAAYNVMGNAVGRVVILLASLGFQLYVLWLLHVTRLHGTIIVLAYLVALFFMPPFLGERAADRALGQVLRSDTIGYMPSQNGASADGEPALTGHLLPGLRYVRIRLVASEQPGDGRLVRDLGAGCYFAVGINARAIFVSRANLERTARMLRDGAFAPPPAGLWERMIALGTPVPPIADKRLALSVRIPLARIASVETVPTPDLSICGPKTGSGQGRGGEPTAL